MYIYINEYVKTEQTQKEETIHLREQNDNQIDFFLKLFPKRKKMKTTSYNNCAVCSFHLMEHELHMISC